MSEDLGTILNKLSAQYQVNIVFDAQHVNDLKIENFEPKSTIEENLDVLLQSTNLTYKKLGAGTYAIKPRSTSTNNEILTNAILAEIKVYGTIKDAETSEPLIGANVLQMGTNNGTVSDIDGVFQLSVDEDAILEVSYIGYVSKEIKVSGQGPYEVYLSRNTNLMEEVIVVGYGSQRKSDLTGAISRIAEEELKQLPTTGLEQAIQGRSAGVYITQNSGAPGGAMSIRIRGTGSTLTSEPLYVVDGIPIVNDNSGTSATFESDGGGQYTNALTTINPNDIESVEILKDASASAIYGARAANGVVIITTKKGKEGQRNVSYESYIGLQQLERSIPVMNLRQYAEYINDVNVGTVEEFENLDLLGEGTNWQDVIFRNAFTHNHQFSITGGDAQTRFSFNGGLHQKDGIVEGSDFTRHSGKINVDHSYNDNIKVGVNILASKTKENVTFNDNSNGVIYTALLTPPMVPARTLDGSYGAPPSGNNIVLTFDNPLANALEVEDVNRKTRLLASFYSEIEFTPWLKYRMEVATDILYTNHNTFWPAFERGTQSRKSRVRRNNSNSLYWINKHLLTYQNTFSEKHKVTLLGGFEAQEGKYEWIYATRDNLPTNELKELNLGDAGTQVVQGGSGHWALLSYFGRLNYGYDDRYLLTGTLRADGSSRFGSNNKFGLFPSLAFAWRISNEAFLDDIEILDNFKLRLGYGAVGNQEIGLYSFAANLQPINVVIGDQLVTGFAPDNIANEDVKWESSVQTNLGVDIGFYNNRLELILDLYNKSSRDMLLPAILPATAGGLNPPFINIGEMRNSGVEFTLNTQNFVGKFNWKSSFNLSVNRNEVIDLGSTGVLTGIIQRVPVTRTVEGMPIGQYYGHQVEGIFRNAAEIAEAPFQEIGTRAGDIKFKDLNEDGVIDDLDKTFIGSPHPDFTINLINDINYRNFDLNIFIRGVYGNEVYNMLRRDLAGTGAWHNQSVDIIDRWSVDNPDGSEPRSNGNDPNSNRRVSDRFVEDGSYLKLQNLSIGYTIPNDVLGVSGISHFRIYLSGQNLITLTNYSGYDPEIGSFNQNPLISGVDNGRFPVARSYTFGLNLNF
ncbi:MAG: SusC/RagA family TonB-linked outer membrane protein [Saprospiraceae bacterium]|nr:SusC/RagA family TonB-linked outer membrane protein [Saprospiraceae bacterium]